MSSGTVLGACSSDALEKCRHVCKLALAFPECGHFQGCCYSHSLYRDDVSCLYKTLIQRNDTITTACIVNKVRQAQDENSIKLVPVACTMTVTAM